MVSVLPKRHPNCGEISAESPGNSRYVTKHGRLQTSSLTNSVGTQETVCEVDIPVQVG